jgi:DNA-binding NarL/FixJ family response regulator
MLSAARLWAQMVTERMLEVDKPTLPAADVAAMIEPVTTLFVVESNTMARAGLRGYLGQNKKWSIVGEASDPIAALVGLKHHPAQIIIMEAGGGLTSPEAVRKIRELAPTSKILLLSSSPSFSEIAILIEAGANGSVLKSAEIEEFGSAINAVMAGGIYLPASVGRQYFGGNTENKSNSFGITTREIQILELVAEGMSNKEIANQINLSVRTVETHRLNIRRKTACHSLSDLVRLAKRIKAASITGDAP